MLTHGLSATTATRWIPLGASLGILGCAWLIGSPAQANVALTRADIEAILNRVELIPQGRSARTARQRDVMAVGDTLRTAAQAQAQLRFNDGSLARVGERATFQFVPNTRNFRLSNGTMLLLIPPGRGRSTIQTPSVTTGIQGSAVVVRHVEESNLTMVMALTNNPAGPMTVTIQTCGDDGAAGNCTTEYDLYAGQMALVRNNQVQILEFDLSTFYDTSPLTAGLGLNNPDPTVSLGPALDQVRAETLEALSEASDFTDAMVLDPAAVTISPSRQSSVNEPWLLAPVLTETQVAGQLPSILPLPSVPNSATAAQPPVVQPPITQPPVAQPPVTQPPVAQPPVAPPVVQPPVVDPPVVTPPGVDPPVVQPPVVDPPTRPTVPANPPPFRDDPTVPARPPAEPPVIFQPSP